MVEIFESLGPQEPSCVHHYIVTIPADNATSGTCKKCGFTREFSQISDDYLRPYRGEKDKEPQKHRNGSPNIPQIPET